MNTKHIVICICLLLGMAQAEDFIKKIFGSNPFTKSITYRLGKTKTTATDGSEATATSKSKRGMRFKFGKSKTTSKPVTTTATEESEPTEEGSEPTTTEEGTTESTE